MALRAVPGGLSRASRRVMTKASGSGLEQRSVAVIGAGAAGLVAARELKREGHSVTVYEQGSRPGGVWLYDDEVEAQDLLGRNPNRHKVHSSMYKHLRTNLPREVMGFSDFPFTPAMMGPARSVDPRRFCSHVEVANYLAAFADYFELNELVQFGTRVVSVAPLQQRQHPSTSPSSQQPYSAPQRWRVTCESTTAAQHGDGVSRETDFDAVVVCNGHYSEPKLPEVRGMESFPGLQMHSHNYRTPDQFGGQVVLVVGASISGDDISREVASTASHVYLSARSWKDEACGMGSAPYGERSNIYRFPLVEALSPDAYAVFPDGQRVGPVHAVIYCTGFQYSFPFLLGQAVQESPSSQQQQQQPGISVHDQRVGPLYRHLFPPSLAPGLSFLGLPWKVVPFPQFELQAKLVARALSGRAALPSVEEMEGDVHEFYQRLEQQGVPVRYTHMQNQDQWQYNDALAQLCGSDVPCTPRWRMQMYTETGVIKRSHPETYRDGPFTVQDEQALKEAYRDLDELSRNLLKQRGPVW